VTPFDRLRAGGDTGKELEGVSGRGGNTGGGEWARGGVGVNPEPEPEPVFRS